MKICHLFFKNTFFLFCFFLLAGATAKAQPCDQQQDSAQVLYFYQALGITVPNRTDIGHLAGGHLKFRRLCLDHFPFVGT